MSYVVTLIANPLQYRLQESDVNRFFTFIEKNGGRVESFEWLGIEEACSIIFDVEDLDAVRAKIAQKDHMFDVVIQPYPYVEKKLLISDMDSTIIQQECIDELADRQGLKAQVSDITERAMNGELDFKESLKKRVGLLTGLDQALLQEVLDTQITLMPGAKILVQTMKQRGAYCALVSGGFTFFTGAIAKKVGFDEDYANRLSFDDGVLTGHVGEPILDKDAKLHRLQALMDQKNLDITQTLAVGDGANDLPMLTYAGLGVAYHAKDAVKAQTSASIDHGDLTALLYLQGIRKDEWCV